jgi:hypothetical protein
VVHVACNGRYRDTAASSRQKQTCRRLLRALAYWHAADVCDWCRSEGPQQPRDGLVSLIGAALVKDAMCARVANHEALLLPHKTSGANAGTREMMHDDPTLPAADLQQFQECHNSRKRPSISHHFTILDLFHGDFSISLKSGSRQAQAKLWG